MSRNVTRISIFIPVSIQPFERGEFADPLDEALVEAGVGEIIEEGTKLSSNGGETTILGCELYLDVSDVQKALALIKRILNEHELPHDSHIRVQNDKVAQQNYVLGDL